MSSEWSSAAQAFEEGIWAALNNWDALMLGVENGWGGPLDAERMHSAMNAQDGAETLSGMDAGEAKVTLLYSDILDWFDATFAAQRRTQRGSNKSVGVSADKSETAGSAAGQASGLVVPQEEEDELSAMLRACMQLDFHADVHDGSDRAVAALMKRMYVEVMEKGDFGIVERELEAVERRGPAVAEAAQQLEDELPAVPEVDVAELQEPVEEVEVEEEEEEPQAEDDGWEVVSSSKKKKNKRRGRRG